MLDFHSHILPGLDDGAANLDTALTMARTAVQDGIEIMVATPHFIEGSMENKRELIIQRVADFQLVIDEKGIPLKVVPGAEIYLSPKTPECLDNGELMTVNNLGKYLLVELPMQSIPDYAEEIFFELKLRGVTPIIAHPERNLEIANKPERALDLVAKGCLLQINASSITGLYGKKVMKIAHLFVKNGLIHLIGSDAHSAGGRSPRIREALGMAEKLLPGTKGDITDYGNKLIAGDEVVIGVPNDIRGNDKGFWDRVKKKIVVR